MIYELWKHIYEEQTILKPNDHRIVFEAKVVDADNLMDANSMVSLVMSSSHWRQMTTTGFMSLLNAL